MDFGGAEVFNGGNMRYLTLALVPWLAVATAAADDNPTGKTTIAVLDFETANASAGDAVVVANFVRSAVVKTRLYSVVERGRMEKVLAEQAFQQAGCTTSDCAVRLGKLLNARKVIAGSLSVLSGDRYLNIRLVDVETGEIENEETSGAFSVKEAPAVAETLVKRLLSRAPVAGGVAPGTTLLSPADEAPEDAGGIVGKDLAPMVLVPAGEFVMGSADIADAKPAHRVSVSAFYMDKHEVTNEQFAKFLNEWGTRTSDGDSPMIGEHKMGLHKVGGRWEPQPGYEKSPVVAVSWYGAAQYAKYYGKRLPTEAEWEYACRAGSTETWHFGDAMGLANKYAWYRKNSGGKTNPVGGKAANAWGLYDMCGNVCEWCADWAAVYKAGPVQDPQGPSSGKTKIHRGGCYSMDPEVCRSAARLGEDPEYRHGTVGFRCARSIEQGGSPIP